MSTKKEYISKSPEETHALAHTLVAHLPVGTVLAFFGDLGAGKTCFIQGLAEALNIHQPVTSPTFTLVNEYSGTKKLYHIDLYRMGGPEELYSLGIEEYLEPDGITAIEWAERAEGELPAHTIALHFATLDNPDERKITILYP